MKLVMTIPYYESDIGKREVLKRCLESVKDECPVIVLAGKEAGFPHAVNKCLETGFSMGVDYVIVSNDDIILNTGHFDELCVPNKVISPSVTGGVPKIFHAHLFCIPKSIWEKVGKWDERFTIYWADTDYAVRLRKLNIPVEINHSVNIIHNEPARTLKSYPSSIEGEDRLKFEDKWGTTYIDPIVEI